MIKNGVIYRSTNRQSDYDDLAIYSLFKNTRSYSGVQIRTQMVKLGQANIIR